MLKNIYKKYEEVYKQDVNRLLFIIGMICISRILYLFVGLIYNAAADQQFGIFRLFNVWDTGWYLNIMQNGYADAIRYGPQSVWAFFPVYPYSVKLFCKIIPIFSFMQGSMIISNLCTVVLSFYAVKYAELTKRNIDEKVLVFLIMFGPYTFYYGSVYTEALFAMLVVMHFYYCKKGKYITAGIVAAIASGTRLVGVFLVFVLIYNMCKNEFGHWSFKNVKDYVLLVLKTPLKLFSILICPFVLFSYMLYQYIILGDVWAFKNAQIGWGRLNNSVYSNIMDALKSTYYPNFYLGVVAIIIFVFYFYLLRKKHFDESIFCLIAFIIPLKSSVGSGPRYAIGTFFVIFAIAELFGRKDSQINGILLSFLGIMEFVLLYFWFKGYSFMI